MIICGTTISGFLLLKLETDLGQIRIFSTVDVLTALQDIFLAFNMFFILDEDQRPDIIRDEGL